MRSRHIVLISITLTLFLGCKDDDSVTCVTCSQPQTLDFTLCEESDGNASVNGENTGVQYNVYLNDLLAEGVNCGGN